MLLKKVILSVLLIGTMGVATTFAQAHTTAVGNVHAGRGSSAIFNVTDFGACGNGEDATAAINAAISAAKDESQTGGTIYFPKGVYVVTSTIFIGDGTTNDLWSRNIGHYISIKGEGIGVSIIEAVTGDDVFCFRGGAQGSGGDDSYDNLSSFNTISDLMIIKETLGGWPVASGGTAINLRRATRPTVKNVEVVAVGNFTFYSGFFLSQDEARLHNVHAQGCGYGILLIGHPNATTISDSWLFSNTVGIYVGGGAGVRILNNTFGGNISTGIKIALNAPLHPSGAVWGLEISGNEMEGNGANSDPNHFEHNHIWFNNPLAGAPHENYARGITISNNYFNLENSVNDGGDALLSPYDIPNTDQRKEITFNRNVYQTGSVVLGTYTVLSEGLTIGQLPVGVAAGATLGPRSLDVDGNITVGIPYARLPNSKLTVFGTGAFATINGTSGGTGDEGKAWLNLRIDEANLWQVGTDNGAINSFFIRANDNDASKFFTISQSGDVGIKKLAIGGGATISKYLSATKTWDPPSINANANTTTTVTVTGAALGDPVSAGLTSLNLGAMNLYGAVTAANTVTVTLVNNTTSSKNLSSGTLRVGIWKH